MKTPLDFLGGTAGASDQGVCLFAFKIAQGFTF